MQMSDIIQNQIQKLPKCPGVYFFKDASGEVMYVGKATSLRDRVRSYWSKELARGPLIEKMVGLICKIDFEKCDSEMEALILEANYIKHYLPKYNTI
jgi:excinuclease ABC subunit C